ncbi:MAG: tetratricopeptide repeat protein, partial [Deltaproteobacteria bacterium]
ALDIMKKITELNPEHAHALNFIAYYYAEKGENLEEAEEKAKKALSLRPNDGYITDTFAWVKFKKGEIEDSLDKLEKAAQLIPDEAIVFEHMGDVYSAKNDKDKALSNYKKAAELAKGKDQDIMKKVEKKLALIEGNSVSGKSGVRTPSNEKLKK